MAQNSGRAHGPMHGPGDKESVSALLVELGGEYMDQRRKETTPQGRPVSERRFEKSFNCSRKGFAWQSRAASSSASRTACASRRLGGDRGFAHDVPRRRNSALSGAGRPHGDGDGLLSTPTLAPTSPSFTESVAKRTSTSTVDRAVRFISVAPRPSIAIDGCRSRPRPAPSSRSFSRFPTRADTRVAWAI